MKNKYYLGLHSSLADSSAAIVKNGELIAAVAEERFNRKKHSGDFPGSSIKFCMEKAGISPTQLSAAAFTFRPWRHMTHRLFAFARGLPSSLSFYGSHSGSWLDMMMMRRKFEKFTGVKKIPFYYFFHHDTHAASAFYLSDFNQCAVLVADGSAEAASTSIYQAENGRLKRLCGSWFPHSLGYFYQSITSYLGFYPACDEGKVMGLAAYGDPDRFPKLARLIRPVKDGIRLNLRYFDFHKNGATAENPQRYVSEIFINRFGKPRAPSEPIEQRHSDIAAGIQKALERALLHLADTALSITGQSSLALSGGVMLNSLANGRLCRERPAVKVFAAPPCGDEGTSIGAAFLCHKKNSALRPKPLKSPFLGPVYRNREIRCSADKSRLPYRISKSPVEEAAEYIAEGKIVGWFRGRSEIGPRALGHRSILADPRNKHMKKHINKKVKYRETFRPFAPAVLYENYRDYFKGSPQRPFMLKVARVRPEKASLIPAVVHKDLTARVQSVRRELAPYFWGVINSFGKITHIPVVLNTSFNVRGEPLVESPAEAINCFKKSGMDILFLEDIVFEKP